MHDNRPISYLPTEGLSYDPSEPTYWQPEMLQQEVERAFEICHGCRMCFKYCDSFPNLFSFLDEEHDGDVRKVTPEQTHEVMSACFQCKLCEVQCPYTPRDDHEFQLDFPRLVHRYRAVISRKEGVNFRDRALASPDAAGKLARMSGGLANHMNRTRIHRWFLEKVLGVHREKLLPEFAQRTFESRAAEQGRIAGPGGEVVLFQTCYVQNNEPQIGLDTLEVLDQNGIDSRCAEGLTCCGMPAWEKGDLDRLRSLAHQNLAILHPYVKAGAKVVAINPTCSMMLRREYPSLLEGRDRELAAEVAGAVRDPSEMLWSIRKEERFNTTVQSRPEGGFAYHAPCHLRAQAVGFKGRDLIRKILDVRPETVLECCGHDGTWSMTTEGFEASQRVGKKSFDGMKAAGAEVWITDCPLASLQFEQHAGKTPLHPMTLLARAYRGEPL